jgi:hypothetical protein
MSLKRLITLNMRECQVEESNPCLESRGEGLHCKLLSYQPDSVYNTNQSSVPLKNSPIGFISGTQTP